MKPLGWMKVALKDAAKAGKKLPKWLQVQSEVEFRRSMNKK